MEFLYPYEKDLPEYQLMAESGQICVRGYRKEKFVFNGIEKEVINPGWYPEDEPEGKYGIYSKEDQKQIHRNINRAKAEAENLLLPEQIKEIREGLGLTQEEAARKIGGGLRSFQRYESGDILPSRSMSNLLRVLKDDPSKLDSILNFCLPTDYE